MSFRQKANLVIDIVEELFTFDFLFPAVIIAVLTLFIFGCDGPRSSTRSGRYKETRANGAIVIEHEDFCSSSAFDNSRCVATYYCPKVPLPDIQVGDVLRLSGCYNTIQDYTTAMAKPTWKR